MSAPVRIMFDLETLSTRHDACILSIGACVFGPEPPTAVALPGSAPVPRTFYVNVEDRTGHVDMDTVIWWFQQSRDAQQRLLRDRIPLDQALFQFFTWCSMHATGSLLGLQEKKANVEFWSRSPSFDEVILGTAYKRADCRSPFYHRWSRDCRTIETAAGIPYDDSFMGGLVHDALNDAQCQARHVEACLRRLEAMKPSAALVQRPADAPGC